MFTVISFQFYNYSCASYDLQGANCSELDGQERYATPPLYSSNDFIPIFTEHFPYITYVVNFPYPPKKKEKEKK